MRFSRKKIAVLLVLILLNASTFSALAQPNITSDTVGKGEQKVVSANIGAQLNSNNPDVDMKRKVKELLSNRTHNSKQYLLEDGSYQAEIYKDDIHYKDDAGNLQDILPRFMDESEITSLKTTYSKDFASKFKSKSKEYAQGIKKEASNYIAAQIPFSVEIPKKIVNGYGIGKDGNEIRIKPLNVSQTASAVLDKTTGSKLTYHNAWKNTDMELIVTSTGIKENIILQNPDSPKKLSFEITRKITDKSKAGNLSLLPLWLVDSKGVYRDVAVKERNEGLKTYLDVEWDASGLEYPVTIDPSVVAQPEGNGLTIVNSSGLNFSPYDIQIGGTQGPYGNPVNAHNANTISYMLYSLPQLPKDIKVKSATLSLYYIRYMTISGGNSNPSPLFEFYPYYVENDITPGATYSWATKPLYSTTISGQMVHLSLTSPTNTLYESDVTQLVKTAYDKPKDKLTIALVPYNHNIYQSDLRVFLGNGYITNKPSKITINYDTDTEPPSSPTELISESFDNTNIYLSWTSSTDNIGVKQYNIYNGDALIGSTSNTNYLVSNNVVTIN